MDVTQLIECQPDSHEAISKVKDVLQGQYLLPLTASVHTLSSTDGLDDTGKSWPHQMPHMKTWKGPFP